MRPQVVWMPSQSMHVIEEVLDCMIVVQQLWLSINHQQSGMQLGLQLWRMEWQWSRESMMNWWSVKAGAIRCTLDAQFVKKMTKMETLQFIWQYDGMEMSTWWVLEVDKGWPFVCISAASLSSFHSKEKCGQHFVNQVLFLFCGIISFFFLRAHKEWYTSDLRATRFIMLLNSLVPWWFHINKH